jgi:hypothetical protein
MKATILPYVSPEPTPAPATAAPPTPNLIQVSISCTASAKSGPTWATNVIIPGYCKNTTTGEEEAGQKKPCKAHEDREPRFKYNDKSLSNDPIYNCKKGPGTPTTEMDQTDLTIRDSCSNLPFSQTSTTPSKAAVLMKFRDVDGKVELRVCCCFDFDFYAGSGKTVRNNFCNMLSLEQAATMCPKCEKLNNIDTHTDFAMKNFSHLSKEIQDFVAGGVWPDPDGPFPSEQSFDEFYNCIPSPPKTPRPIPVPALFTSCPVNPAGPSGGPEVIIPTYCTNNSGFEAPGPKNACEAHSKRTYSGRLSSQSIRSCGKDDSGDLPPFINQGDMTLRDSCSNLPFKRTSAPLAKAAVLMNFKKAGVDTLQVCCCFNFHFYPSRGKTVHNNFCNMINPEHAAMMCPNCYKLEAHKTHTKYAKDNFNHLLTEIEQFEAKGTEPGRPIGNQKDFDNYYECIVGPKLIRPIVQCGPLIGTGWPRSSPQLIISAVLVPNHCIIEKRLGKDMLVYAEKDETCNLHVNRNSSVPLPLRNVPVYNCKSQKKVSQDLKDRDDCSNLPFTSSDQEPPVAPKKTAVLMQFKNKTGTDAIHVCCCFDYEIYIPPVSSYVEHSWKRIAEANFCNMVSSEHAENLCNCLPLKADWLHMEYARDVLDVRYALRTQIKALENTLTPDEAPKMRKGEFDRAYKCINTDPSPRQDIPFYPIVSCPADEAWLNTKEVLVPAVCSKNWDRVLEAETTGRRCRLREYPDPKPNPLLFNCNTKTLVDAFITSWDHCSNFPITTTSTSLPVKTGVVMEFKGAGGADVLQVCCCFDYDFYASVSVTAQNNNCNLKSKKLC